MKYRKIPVEVEALQIHRNVEEIKEFIGENGDAYTAGDILDRPHTVVLIYTLEGIMRATDGDYIIKGVKGEFYPCRKDIFEETYELVESKYNLPTPLPFIPPRLDNVEWKIGDHVKFKTNGGWYNTGVIEDIDEDSCLVKIEWLGFESSSSLNAPDRVRLPLYKLMRR